jgi:hypothetical protein
VDGADVHPIRGTAGTARGAEPARSNEWLGLNADSNLWMCGALDAETALKEFALLIEFELNPIAWCLNTRVIPCHGQIVNRDDDSIVAM